MYLTFEEYQELHEDMEFSDDFESLYPILEREVEAKINYRTFNRFKSDTTYPTELLNCVSSLVDLIYSKRNLLETDTSSSSSSSNQAVTSQSNDGVSISYRKLTAENLLTSLDNEITKTINTYLYGVRNTAGNLVLYRGIYPDE